MQEILKYIDHKNRKQAIYLLDYIADLESHKQRCLDDNQVKIAKSFQVIIDRYMQVISILANHVK